MPAWSGFWNHTYSDGHKFMGRAQAVRRAVGRVMHGQGRAGYNSVVHTLVNGNVGDTALKTHVRVASQNVNDPMSLGGKRTTEVKTIINRATTDNDRLIILDDFDYDNSPEPWPVDKSGNGGGGKVGL